MGSRYKRKATSAHLTRRRADTTTQARSFLTRIAGLEPPSVVPSYALSLVQRVASQRFQPAKGHHEAGPARRR